jgi:hypothetical protein
MEVRAAAQMSGAGDQAIVHKNGEDCHGGGMDIIDEAVAI